MTIKTYNSLHIIFNSKFVEWKQGEIPYKSSYITKAQYHYRNNNFIEIVSIKKYVTSIYFLLDIKIVFKSISSTRNKFLFETYILCKRRKIKAY